MDLSAELALDGHDWHRAFSRERENFRGMPVNELCAKLHRELIGVVRVNTTTQAVPSFQQGHAESRLREAAGCSKSGNPAADDQCVHSVAAVTFCFAAPVTGIG